jgi:cytochrome c-type biogenesis protein CcmH/NrfF
MRAALALVVLAAALAAAGSAAASEQHPTLAELEREVICPTCHTTLELSNAPIAERMRAFIRSRIAAGDTKSEIKAKLVADFGEGVLAAPPKSGFNLLAWVLPLAGLAVAAVVLALAVYAAATRSPLALKALTGVVVAAGAALCLLVALVYVKSQPRR